MERRLPPVWLMGFLGNLPLSISATILLMTVPQLLAARGVPEPQIAIVTTAGLAPGFISFLFSPLLDWRFRRRSYAIALLLVTALLQFAVLVCTRDLPLLAALLFASSMVVRLQRAAVSGWLGTIVPQDDKGTLGAWYSVSGTAGFGVMAVLAITLLRQIPYPAAAAILSLVLLAPLPLYLVLPSQPADRRLARESFASFFRDVLRLLKQREMLFLLPFFLLPVGDFALTNMLGGLGAVFGVSEAMVGAIAGVGATMAGILGSLAVPPLLRLLRPLWLYLAIGVSGALFTLFLSLLPHAPWVFALAMLGENIFQSAALAIEFTICLRSIGQDSAFAATQFAVLNSAANLPLTYMQAMDGQAYGWRGFGGTMLFDAGLGLLACGVLAVLALRRRAGARPQ
jgi:PAT family beta-lactamase induction signal transducer AmpG